MYNIFGVKVFNTEAQVNEYLPYDVVHKWLREYFLLFNEGVQVAHWTVLQHYVDFLAIYEAVEVSHNVVGVHELHDLDLLHGLHAYVVRNLGHINHFDHIELVLEELAPLGLLVGSYH